MVAMPTPASSTRVTRRGGRPADHADPVKPPRPVGILGPMPALPSGTVTFVFSDIEGSTSLLKALGDRYGEVLDDHRALIRETFGARDGVEIDTQGDAFFFAFTRARDAVAAAVEAQRRHASHRWPDDRAVRVRMGLHTGEPALGSEGYLGIDVVRAARLCTLGRGGHVLLSETTRALIGGNLPDGVGVTPLGERRLKDIDEPERVFELAIDGVTVSEETGEAASPPAPPAPVPPPTTPDPAAPTPPPTSMDDFGAMLSRRIEEHVRRAIEAPIERALSEVDALADRAARRPDVIDDRDDTE